MINKTIPDKQVLTLIKAHTQSDEKLFQSTCALIADLYEKAGKHELMFYVEAQIGATDTFVTNEQ